MKKINYLKKTLLITIFTVCLLCAFCFTCGCDGKEQQITNNEQSQVLTLDKSKIQIEIGEEAVITGNMEGIILTSADDSIAKIENGKIIGINNGTTIITATKGEQTASCEVTVNEKLIESGNFYLTAEKKAIFKDRSISISAVMYYGAKLIDNKDLSLVWSSSNEEIVSVDQNGRVTGNGIGSAIITCKTNYNNKEFIDTVEISVETFTVLLADKEEIMIASGITLSGNTNSKNTDVFTFKAYDADEQLLNVNTDDVTYSSSDENIVLINGNGKLTAVNSGSATVTATLGNNSCSAIVNVVTSINCIEDMNTLAYAVKDGKDNLWDSTSYYVLTSDIDYKNCIITPIGVCSVEGYSWRESFGNLNPQSRSFDATFDGNGYTIKNALIAENISSNSTTLRNCVFGYTKGLIKNICFDNIKFETKLKIGNSGIFSQMYGTIENILVTNGLINATASSATGFFSSGFLVATFGSVKRLLIRSSCESIGEI